VVKKKFQRPRKSAAEFYADFLKNGREGAELFEVCLSLRQFSELDPTIS
jgi:hypothetical protein